MKLLKFIWNKIKQPLITTALTLLGIIVFAIFAYYADDYAYIILKLLCIFIWVITLPVLVLIIIDIIKRVIYKIKDLKEEYKEYKKQN